MKSEEKVESKVMTGIKVLLGNVRDTKVNVLVI